MIMRAHITDKGVGEILWISSTTVDTQSAEILLCGELREKKW